MDENKKDDAIKKMLDAAQMMSQLAGQNSTGEDALHFDFTKMMKAAEMFQELNQSDPLPNKIPSIHFDEQLQTPQMKAVKSAIPYLPYKEQKYVGLLVKLMEIKNLLTIYQDQEDSHGPSRRNTKDTAKILGSIKPYVDAEKQGMIDMCVKMLEMKKIVACFDKEGTL